MGGHGGDFHLRIKNKISGCVTVVVQGGAAGAPGNGGVGGAGGVTPNTGARAANGPTGATGSIAPVSAAGKITVKTLIGTLAKRRTLESEIEKLKVQIGYRAPVLNTREDYPLLKFWVSKQNEHPYKLFDLDLHDDTDGGDRSFAALLKDPDADLTFEQLELLQDLRNEYIDYLSSDKAYREARHDVRELEKQLNAKQTELGDLEDWAISGKEALGEKIENPQGMKYCFQ